MSPEGVDGRFDSVGARKLGHLLAGRTEIGGVVAFAEGLQHPAEHPPGLGDLIVQPILALPGPSGAFHRFGDRFFLLPHGEPRHQELIAHRQHHRADKETDGTLQDGPPDGAQ